MTDNSLNRVIEIFKLMCHALLNKNTGLMVDAKKAENNGQVMLVINAYCESPRDVGILLGKKEHHPRTKDALVKILQQVAFYAGVTKIDLTIDDVSKLPN